MRINPYLSFAGNCREAFEFYARVLRGTIVAMMRQGDAPIADQLPPESRDAVMHAQLQIGDQVLMGGDAPPGSPKPAGICVTLNIDAVDEAERVYAALAEGGTTVMPIAETFWAQRFGIVHDRYGTPWMINCMKPMP
ncbi:MAG: VOC family protein [Xanthomonadaceae bacterium]|nr:VOC family protein [Xanthomonadaceae bacterium]